ncbi:MAG TPA: hypothetical protein VL486_13190 [Verrucomicrobiae bacterium]|nr:hypothetical protein [Verrucomicrobiae bacterium]
MSDRIPVQAIVVEKTHVGKVNFPASVPERFFELIRFPEDLYEHVEKMGLTQRTVKFLLAALNGKWALSASIDLQDIAIKTAMQYSEMDAIVRDLLEKNYARFDKRLDLYRFWVALLYVKGVRFELAEE